MINRINYRSLNEVLLQNSFFIVSFETFKQRVLSNRMRVARSFFEENEDYHLLQAMQNQESFFSKYHIYVSIYQNKKLFINKNEFYSKLEYEAIFSGTGIKLSKEEINSLIRIANGY